jgi:hypothetical protein
VTCWRGSRRPTAADREAFRRIADAARALYRSKTSPPMSGDDNTGPTGPQRQHMADPTRPKLHAYFVKPPKNDDGKPVWIKVGAAFENRDGSLSLSLDCIPPPDGPGWRLQLREPYDDERADAADKAPPASTPPRQQTNRQRR